MFFDFIEFLSPNLIIYIKYIYIDEKMNENMESDGAINRKLSCKYIYNNIIQTLIGHFV